MVGWLDSLTAYGFGSFIVMVSVIFVILILRYFIPLPFWAIISIAFLIGWLINFLVLNKLRVQERISNFFIEFKRNWVLYKELKRKEKEIKEKKEI